MYGIIFCAAWDESLDEPTGAMRCLAERGTLDEAVCLALEWLQALPLMGWGAGLVVVQDGAGRRAWPELPPPGDDWRRLADTRVYSRDPSAPCWDDGPAPADPRWLH